MRSGWGFCHTLGRWESRSGEQGWLCPEDQGVCAEDHHELLGNSSRNFMGQAQSGQGGKQKSESC